ncbi:MAG: PAS domain S-box protein [Ignavibacteriales bacterium]|nr:PAS domain S-box protein [Ignavibacteriales bacterium]
MNKKLFFSLRVRLLLLIIIAVIPGLFLAIYTINEERQREKDEAQDYAIRLAHIIAVQEQDMMDATRQLLITVSYVFHTEEIKPDQCNKFLVGLLSHFKRYTNFGVCDTQGNVIGSAIPLNKQTNLADRGYFQKALQTGDFAIGEYQIGRITGKPSINLAYPLLDENGKKQGVVFAALNIEKLGELETRVAKQLPQGSTMSKIDKNGILLARYPDGEGKIGHPAFEFSHILDKLTQTQGVIWANDTNGILQIYAYSTIKSRFSPSGVSVVLNIPENLVFQEINNTFNRNLVVLGIAAIVILFIGALSNELFIVRGLNSLRNAAQEIAFGNLQTRARDIRGIREIKHLAHTFNGMAVSLEKREAERERAEQSLKEASDNLNRLLAASPTILYAAKIEGQYTIPIWVTQNIKRILGYEVEDALKSDWWVTHMYPEDRERTLSIMTILNSKDFHAHEYRFLRNDDTVLWIYDEFRVLRDVSDRPTEIVGSWTDITDRKQTEQALKDSEEKYRNIVTWAPVGIFQSTPDGKFLSANPRLAELLGYTSIDELLTRNLETDIYFNPDDRRSAINEYDRKGFAINLEVLWKKKDGTQIYIDLTSHAVKDKSGRTLFYEGFVNDVTEKKKIEAQLLRNQRMESIGTLAGGIAHDLNNVLGPILLSLDILRCKFKDEQTLKMLEMLEATTNRGANLIKQILSFARGVEGERTIIQIRHLIGEIKKIFNETFPKSITLTTDIPKNLWTMSGDATQIHQILMNICVNARDAMPKGGAIAIKAENINLDDMYSHLHVDAKPGPHVVISVTDSGTGMSPEIIDKIFEPFFTTKGLGKGTGLGLATVLSIVKSHGGFVNVYSEVGKGTTFKVYLPSQEGVQLEIEEEKEELPVGNGELILVVDDEATIREITKSTLVTYGYTVLTANDGIEAIALYSEHKNRIALLLTDMMMPNMGGVDTIRVISKMNPKVKVVAVSGLAQDVSVAEMKEEVVFLNKPYTSEILLKTVGWLKK